MSTSKLELERWNLRAFSATSAALLSASRRRVAEYAAVERITPLEALNELTSYAYDAWQANRKPIETEGNENEPEDTTV